MKKSNLFKQILAYTLVLSVIFSQMVFSFGASAAEVTSVWDGTKAENFAGGDGSAASPFLIDTAEQLYKMVVEYSTRTASEGKYFKITNDLYLNDVADGKSIVDLSGIKNWLAGYGDTIATASEANSFNGTLDGAGHTIYGLYVQGVNSAGLFPAISSYAVVKNLNFNNLLISGGSGYGGAIAGQAIYYTWKSAAQITNCSVVNATIGQWQNKQMVGGFIGNINECTVTFTNCYSYDLSLSNWTESGVPGGIVGSAYKSGTLKIINSYSAGNFPVNSLVNKAQCTNVYTDTAIPEGNTTAGVTVLTAEKMKGENAKTYMTGFDFELTWKTVDGSYPVLRRINFWDGTKADAFAGGSGTEADPYIVENGAQLFKMVKDYTAVSNDSAFATPSHFKITADIYLNPVLNSDMSAPSVDSWNERGFNGWLTGYNYAQYTGFCGVVDGGGHIIYGLYAKEGTYSGLLPNVADSATVKNLHLRNSFVRAGGNGGPGGIIGVVNGTNSNKSTATVEGCTIDNCYIFADHTNSWRCGGIVGGGYNEGKITVSNCAVTNITMVVTNTSTVQRTCPLIGNTTNSGHEVKNCYTDASTHPVTNATTSSNYDVIHKNKTYTNVYTCAAKPEFDTNDDITYLTAEQMKGAAAATNMPGLDFEFIWKTVENDYPIIRDNALIYGNLATANSFAGGQGTASDPYVIKTAEQLKKMVADYSNTSVAEKPESHTYFKIANDIDLAGKQWYTHSIWSDNINNTNYTTGFSGIIYGEGHTISGLTVNGTTSYSSVGLIPVATQGAEIHDLNLKNGKLKQTGWNGRAVGAIIGLAVGAAGSAPIVIDNCSVQDFNISSENGSAAFVAYSYSQSIIIKNCYCTDVSLVNTASDANSNSGAFVAVTNGSDTNNSIVIEKSFCDDVNSTILHKENMASITTFNNVYTQDADYANTVTGLTKLTAAQMTGVAAKANMVGFNFNQIWQNGAEGEYPTHKTNEEKAMYWNGTSAYSFAGGQGTINNPYEISTADQLFLLANAGTEETKGKYYKLTRDINISKVYEGWENDNPYSWTKKTAYLDGFGYSNSFAGTLDGAGYTVRGLYYTDEITNNGTYAYGLIPFVSANAVIKNLNVEDVSGDVTGNAYKGAVAGAAHVTETDVANALNMVQFVGVNLANSDLALLGGASRGVKFELCNAEEFIGSESEKISIRNCNNENYSYNGNVLIYNALNADSNALANAINYLLGNQSNYITEINGDATFDIRDLVSIKKYLTMASSDDYKLVWSQEFNGNAVDYSVLTTNKTMSVGSTLKYADNAVVNNGSLKLSCSDTGTTDTNGDKIYSVNYGLSTIDTMSFKYGKLEMRAKVPFAAAAFPSLWLTSRNAIGYETNSEYSNEIDIFEMFGKTNNNDTLISCIHKWYNDENGNRVLDENDNPVECSCGSGILAGNGYKVAESDRDYQITGDAQNEYHTFVFEWDENSMSFSVDGNVYYTARKSEMSNFDISGYNTSAEGIFGQFLCIRLNNHMYTTGDGAAYKYSGDATEIDPSKINFEIDYIRLYQKDNGKINLK